MSRKKRKKMNSTVVEFGRKSFTAKRDSITGDTPVLFKIDDWWMLNGYQHPVRYPRTRAVEALDWCAVNAPGAHLINMPGRTMLFKDEMVATMFKLTFSEGQ